MNGRVGAGSLDAEESVVVFISLLLYIGVIDVDGVDDVDAEGLVDVLEFLPPCFDVVCLDGVDDVFEGDFFSFTFDRLQRFLPYINIWLHDFFFVVSNKP